jgi:hypothetical protein
MCQTSIPERVDSSFESTGTTLHWPDLCIAYPGCEAYGLVVVVAKAI